MKLAEIKERRKISHSLNFGQIELLTYESLAFSIFATFTHIFHRVHRLIFLLYMVKIQK